MPWGGECETSTARAGHSVSICAASASSSTIRLRIDDAAAEANSEERDAADDNRLAVQQMGQRPVGAGGEQLAEVVVISRDQHKGDRHSPKDAKSIRMALGTGGKIAGSDHHIRAAAFIDDRLGLRGIPMQIAEGKDLHLNFPAVTVATILISRSATSGRPASSASPTPVLPG